MNRLSCSLAVISLAIGTSTGTLSAQKSATKLSPMEELGKRLFFDTNLSTPSGQECAVCHGPSVGFTGPDAHINRSHGVYEGAVKGRFGNRKPPSSAYAGGSPRLHRNQNGEFVGGMFWDGRAAGDTLGDPLAEQAMGPFLNPLEQNMPDKKSIILAVRKSDYARLFEQVWGAGSLDAEKDVDGTYVRIARSIAAYERSDEVNPYSSKFDDFWRKARAGGLKVEAISESSMSGFRGLGLTDTELRGLAVFNTRGRCANCHLLTTENGKPLVFTDYRYDNLGIPRNPNNPFYRQDKKYNPDGAGWIDKGLGGYLETVDRYKQFAAAHYGSHKTPTLRNVDRRPSPDFAKAFMHNGYFKSLKEVVHFYNTRDKAGAKWPPPEVAANVNRAEMGDLGLTDDEENAIVEFMKTLSDRH